MINSINSSVAMVAGNHISKTLFSNHKFNKKILLDVKSWLVSLDSLHKIKAHVTKMLKILSDGRFQVSPFHV